MKRLTPSTEEALELFRQCTPLFQALGDRIRQSIILLLAEHESLNVNQIAEQIPLSRPAISHHLKILRETGLVLVNRKGTENFYSLEVEESIKLLKKLIQAVEETCF
ncbi:transcriptional regulator [Collibacillus ludicampi]|jgi:DNA-binding transcriptional ArsR family regulator|uniref:Transcriptional regulator n=1 Tax=Collibacillus ludicampi TaxID=2771369 RepID=A0AAV4LIW6_9BACL|nr:metalloregulator ArsR/SmtB family transcription factor [Collibacillus ludicampi]GIM47735.1 transcriptional regulator [Collibacillus ludicampi]